MNFRMTMRNSERKVEADFDAKSAEEAKAKFAAWVNGQDFSEPAKEEEPA